MIGELLLIGKLSACLHIANTAPALSMSLCSQQKLATREIKDRLPRQRLCNHRSTVVSLTSITWLFSVVCRFGSLAHLLVALRLGLSAVYTGNWHSLWRLHAWTNRSRIRREFPWTGCVRVREGHSPGFGSAGIKVLGRTWGRSGGVQGGSAIWASGSSLRMKTAHWSR